MRVDQTIRLKDGRLCRLRSGEESDGQAVFDNFNLTHGETDFLTSYPDENSFDPAQEGRFLREKADSENEVMILAVVDGRVVGTAGIEAVGAKYKVRHRAEFGISVAMEFWGLGIGSALTAACIDCARKAGYVQLELIAVAENERALTLYRRAGFVEYGRNPKGFYSRAGRYQELISMRLDLEERNWMVRRLNDPEEKRAAAQTVLNALPDWFGIPESTAEYVKNSGELPVWAAYEEDALAGFIAMKPTSPKAAEIYVMGVMPSWHRRGVGRALFEALRDAAIAEGYRYLHVKTVRRGVWPQYDLTNDFYRGMGFDELECLPELWDECNPCQLYIMTIGEEKNA